VDRVAVDDTDDGSFEVTRSPARTRREQKEDDGKEAQEERGGSRRASHTANLSCQADAVKLWIRCHPRVASTLLCPVTK